MRRYAGHTTAIVSVADDGGSSGRLRKAFGIPAPGDARKCLVSLADEDSLWGRAFEHRFESSELEGHALGNLIIAGLAEVTGDFVQALDQAGELLGTEGRVLPATVDPVVLKAEVGGASVEGQLNVHFSAGITTVSIVPPDATVPDAAVDAIATADQIVVGPGSLFTSVLAVVAVPGLRDALARTAARKVYVCNLRPQVPETEGFDVAAHLAALRSHGLEVDVVLCHPAALPRGEVDVPCVERPVARDDGLAHDPVRLAAALVDLVG